jgi:hypothetical protein
LLLLERAVKRRWNIDCEAAAQTVNDLLRSPDERIAARAAAIAAVMEGQNQKDEHKVLDVRVQIRHDQLPGIAADLGVDIAAIEDVTRQANSSAGNAASESD